MGDIWDEVLKRYGATALVAALIAGIAIWGLAHIVSEPGSEVSVLWGLVKYTKKHLVVVGPSEQITPPSSVNVEDSETKSEQSSPMALPTIELFLRPGVHTDNLQKTLNDIRNDRSLRQLTVAEDGRPFKEIPSGTYFFLFSGSIDRRRTGESFLGEMSTNSVSRYSSKNTYVEVQYPRSGEPHFIVFFDESTAQAASVLSGIERREVTAYIEPWGNATILASVPVGRVVSIRPRVVRLTVDDINFVLDIVLE